MVLSPRAPPDAYPDDCGGDVRKAEIRVFDKVKEYLSRSTLKDLFQRMNKRRNGELNTKEWVDGMLEILHVKCSREMLVAVYQELNLGADHLGSTVTDDSLCYKEFCIKLEDHRLYPRTELPGTVSKRHRAPLEETPAPLEASSQLNEASEAEARA